MDGTALTKKIPTRTEKDSFGDIEVPADRYWGAQTERARRLFKIGDETMPLALIHALAWQKKAAARANMALGALDLRRGAAIVVAADEIIDGKLDDHFPLPVWQTGSGTQTNMNLNEVIANRANEILGAKLGAKSPVHPNDHVNLSQSSNDSFPTAMHIAGVFAIERGLLPALHDFADLLAAKSDEFRDLVKIGRTHLQDAVPMTLGQEFSGYAAQVAFCESRIAADLPGLYLVAQGGTAIGTGLNATRGFAERFIVELALLTGLPFAAAPNKFAAIAAHDAILAAAGALNTLAAALMKITNDIRLLGSGPRAGLGELALPENEPGSSIMPGKVNPTQAEALGMICAQVFGNHTTITAANAGGQLELNTFKPVIAANFLQSIRLLSDGVRSFGEHCIAGIAANPDRLRRHVQDSLMLVTALAPRLGYDDAARIAQRAHAEGTSLRQAAIALGLLTAAEFDALVRPDDMIGERE